MKRFEEEFAIGRGWGWAILAIYCAIIIAWGITNYSLIRDRPREWDFGVVPDAPGQSVYSNAPGEVQPEGPQLERLPEAKPREERAR